MSSYDYLVKLLLIGDSSVGKSSLLFRFADNKFSPDYMSTIGIDYKIKTIEIDGVRLKIEVWDTAGQERFRTITTAYYRGAQGILLVFDVTSERSFKQVQEWLTLIKKHAADDVSILLVANKADVVGPARAVSTTRLEAFANEQGLKWIETSALSGHNVEQVFAELGKDVLTRLEKKKQKTEENRSGELVNINTRDRGGGNGSVGCCK